jgi:hypothetical protein
MPEDWLNQQPYRDTIKVPAVLQLPGDPFPTEFYARYPKAFRVPVGLVWRDGPTQPDAAPPRPTQQIAPSSPSGGNSAWTETQAPEANAPEATAPITADRDDYQRADPVGAYLRVNDFLDRLLGRAAPAPDGPRAQGPNAAIPFFDDRGRPVIGPDGKQMMRPADNTIVYF